MCQNLNFMDQEKKYSWYHMYANLLYPLPIRVKGEHFPVLGNTEGFYVKKVAF